MKAYFEMGPFKTIMDIKHPHIEYYFALQERTDWFRLLEPDSISELAMPSPIKKLKFRLETYSTFTINDEVIYMPFYRFHSVGD